jgi:hypothetical protein
MAGAGSIVMRNDRYGFVFRVRETESGGERGFFHLRGSRVRFSSTSVDFVRFDGQSVVFRGTGQWNGAAGHRYEVSAADLGTGPGRPDVVDITVVAPNGRVVAHIAGPLKSGGVRAAKRLR